MARPSVLYLCAFNNGPNDDPALITTIASPPGTLGATNVWTDVSRFVLNDNGARGRQQELQSFEAGTRELHLDNTSGRFTPWNTSSPYTGLVVPGKLVQVRASWLGVTYYRFTGQVSGWYPEWPDETNQTCLLKVADAFRMWNNANFTTGGYPSQVIADGVHNYWRFGDLVGSQTAADSGPAGQSATVTVPTVTFGQPGAFKADTTSSALFLATASLTPTIQLPNLINVIWNGDLTLEFWINTAYTAASNTNITLLYLCSGGNGQAVLEVDTNANTVKLTSGGAGAHTLSASATLSDGIWHHVMGVLSVTGSTHTIYVDGVSAGSDGVAPVISQTAVLSTISSTAQTPGALLQEVAVYPSVLTSGQAANHFSLGIWTQEGAGARVNRVLTAQGWSAGARFVNTGRTSTVQAPASSLTNTSVLGHLQEVEATESGAFFMQENGVATFLSRYTLLSSAVNTTSQATLGDNTAGDDIPYLPGPTLSRDDLFLYTTATATRAGGVQQTATNGNPGNTWTPPASLIGISDAEVLGLANYVVDKFGTPVDRLQSVTVDVLAVAAAFPAVIPTLFTLKVLNRITVERTLMPGGGTAFSQECQIEHIDETINAKQWYVTFQLAVADKPFWILDTSQLGISTRLAF